MPTALHRGAPLSMLVALTLLAGSCGITRMLPEGPVLEESERRRLFSEIAASPVQYDGGPLVDGPVLPFMVFGISYDLDIVLVSEHPHWDMHEYARLQTPDGPVWLAKDSRARDGDQQLVAGLENLYEILPEVPLERKKSPVRVEDRSEGDSLDLDIAYINHRNERVRVHYEGPAPHTEMSDRNGSTMGHSRDQVIAVLDLPRRDFGDEASIRIGEQSYGIERALGIKPLRMALEQTQGGIAEGRVEYLDAPDSSEATRRSHATTKQMRTRHHLSGGRTLERTWSLTREGDALVAHQRSELRTLGYRFRVGADEALELTEAWVRAWNAERDTFHITFAPALPDLRRPFAGSQTSRWVMDIGGQRNHATGTVRISRVEGGARLEVRGTEPWWVAERCATTEINFAERRADAVTEVRPCPE